jgi:hypothetical protein
MKPETLNPSPQSSPSPQAKGTLPPVPRAPLAVVPVAKRTAGRPTKKTPACVARVLDEVRKGLPLKTAATLAGISEDTLQNWRNTDARFAELLEQALAESEAALVAGIQAAAAKDWRAQAFLLERRFPATWGKRSADVQHNHLHVGGQELLRQLSEQRREYDARQRAQAITVETVPMSCQSDA